MPVVAICDPIADSATAFLRRHAEVLEPPAQGWEALADAVIVRASPVTAAAIAAARRLRVIGKHGVGTDNIALDAAAARGIPVHNTPGANAGAVAELTIGLILSVLRAVAWHDRRIRDRRGDPAPTVGRELADACVGLLGFGDIARRVARICHGGFGARVAAFDPYRARLPTDPPVTMVDDLPTLFATSRIVSVHVPLTPATRHLVGSRLLSVMPQGAILINTGRGGVVDEAALLAALDAGSLAGAGLDVFEVEPPRADLPLLRHPGVVATPHIGAATGEAMARMGRSVAEQVLTALGVDWGRDERKEHG